MPAMLSVPTRRLRRKTWIGFHIIEEEEPTEPRHAGQITTTWQGFLCVEALEAEPKTAKKSVYLVTLPALRWISEGGSSRGLLCPSQWKHEDVARVILDVFKNPAYTANNEEWGTSIELECFVIFRERHALVAGDLERHYHWHVAVKASGSFRFAAFKRALSLRHCLASHWSTSHNGYWSAVRYGYMPSENKPQVELDTDPWKWSKSGTHPPLFETSQEPTTAAALQRRRENKVMKACSAGKPEPRPTEMDLYPVIVMQGFRNTPDDMTADKRLVQYLKRMGLRLSLLLPSRTGAA